MNGCDDRINRPEFSCVAVKIGTLLSYLQFSVSGGRIYLPVLLQKIGIVVKNIVATVAFLVYSAAGLGAQDLSGIDFHLQDINGEDQSFEQYLAGVRGTDQTPKNGVVMIVFWGLCKACQQEMKALRSMYEEYSSRNFRILAININDTRSTTKVKSYIIAHKLPYDVWLDPVSEVFTKLGGQAVPYTLIIDSDGKVVLKQLGFFPGDQTKFQRAVSLALE